MSGDSYVPATQPEPGMDAFALLVDADSRGEASAEEAAWLRSPEVVDRWVACLQEKVTGISTQLVGNDGRMAELRAEHFASGGTSDAWGEIKNANKVWRSKASYAQAKIRERLVEARALKHEATVARKAQQAASTSAAFRSLRRAVREHREAILAADGYDPTPADEALWAALDAVDAERSAVAS